MVCSVVSEQTNEQLGSQAEAIHVDALFPFLELLQWLQRSALADFFLKLK